MMPAEVAAVAEGYLWRMDRWGVLLSGFTAAIVQPWAKRRIRPRDLYRPVLRAEERRTKDERQQQFERAVALMGPDRYPVRSTGSAG